MGSLMLVEAVYLAPSAAAERASLSRNQASVSRVSSNQKAIRPAALGSAMSRSRRPCAGQSSMSSVRPALAAPAISAVRQTSHFWSALIVFAFRLSAGSNGIQAMNRSMAGCLSSA